MAYDPKVFDIDGSDSDFVRVAKRMHLRALEHLNLSADDPDLRTKIIEAMDRVPLCKTTGRLFGDRVPDINKPSMCLLGAMAHVCWGATSEGGILRVARECSGPYRVPSRSALDFISVYSGLLFGMQGAQLYELNDGTDYGFPRMLTFLRNFVSMANTENGMLFTTLYDHRDEFGVANGPIADHHRAQAQNITAARIEPIREDEPAYEEEYEEDDNEETDEDRAERDAS